MTIRSISKRRCVRPPDHRAVGSNVQASDEAAAADFDGLPSRSPASSRRRKRGVKGKHRLPERPSHKCRKCNSEKQKSACQPHCHAPAVMFQLA